MGKFVVGAASDRITPALFAAGLIKDDPCEVRRIVLDFTAGQPARLYVEKFVDDSIADVLLSAGIHELPEAS